MKNYKVVALVVSCLLTLAGFLFSLLLTASPAVAQASQTITLSLADYKITPNEISVPQGQPVKFTVTNNGDEEHNFVVELEEQNIEQKLFATNLMPGETRTAEFTFNVAGEWEMYCPVDGHKAHGMKGDIRVMSGPGMPSTGSAVPALACALVVAAVCLALLSLGLFIRRISLSRRAQG